MAQLFEKVELFTCSLIWFSMNDLILLMYRTRLPGDPRLGVMTSMLLIGLFCLLHLATPLQSVESARDYHIQVVILDVAGEEFPYQIETITEQIWGEGQSLQTDFDHLSGGKITFHPPDDTTFLRVTLNENEMISDGMSNSHYTYLAKRELAQYEYRHPYNTLNPYNTLIIYHPDFECPYLGRAELGGDWKTRTIWMACQSYNTLFHEFGHRLGLHHIQKTDRDGKKQEYGDPYSTLGNGVCLHEPVLNAPHLHQLKWQPVTKIQLGGEPIDFQLQPLHWADTESLYVFRWQKITYFIAYQPNTNCSSVLVIHRENSDGYYEFLKTIRIFSSPSFYN